MSRSQFLIKDRPLRQPGLTQSWQFDCHGWKKGVSFD